MFKNFKSIYLVAKIYVLALIVFFCFRFVLFLTELNRVVFTYETTVITLKAFLMGIRFDVVICGYIMLLPALILSVLEIANIKIRSVHTILFYWVLVFFTLSFAICAADIPYFNQFFSRFSMGAFEWLDSPLFVLHMVAEEPKYFLFAIPWVLLVVVFYKRLKSIFEVKQESNTIIWPYKVVVSIVFLGIIFIGVRGRIENKSPIRIGTAYFSNHAFLNQLGLNPVYTLLNSYVSSISSANKKVNLIEETTAVKNVQAYLNVTKILKHSPIARNIQPKGLPNKKNVIVIMMESMSASHMSRHGSGKNVTPFLDSLANQSYYFENLYSAGKHTHNGIFSTLFSFPALYKQHILKNINSYHGMASVLKKNGYSTTYFTTHDGQFDNVEGFLRANDFENVNDVSAYPSEEVKTTFGVPDDFMFRFSIPKINTLNKSGKPFFVSLMTTSDHGPFYIPPYFTPKSKKGRVRSVEYADWSLKQFFELAKKQEWFQETLFVLVADHGLALTAAYDISLDYHHSPGIIYNPDILGAPKSFHNIAGQIDIFPTIMGVLNIPYVNNTLGIDLLRETKPFTIINDDDKVAVLDNNYLMILNDRNEKKLYHYQDLDTKNYAKDFPEKVKAMDMYLRSNLQVFQSMINKNQLSVK